MAKASTATSDLKRSEIKALWSHITPANWLDVLKTFKRENGFIRISNTKLRGLCIDPKHHDTSPSFFIDTERGFAKCYGSSCGYYESDPIRLISTITGKSLAESLKYVITTFKPPNLSTNAVTKFEKAQQHQVMKQKIFTAAQQLTWQALQNPENPEAAWAQPALDWLINKRKISAQYLYALPVAVMPDLTALQATLVGMYAYEKEAWLDALVVDRGPAPVDHSANAVRYMADVARANMVGTVLFPQHATPTEISRFKLRRPDINVGDAKQIFIVDDPHDDGLGLYGLGWGPYHNLLSHNVDTREVLVTEGEFDVLSVMSAWCQDGVEPSIPIVGAGGVGGAKDIEVVLENVGVTNAYFVGDAPDKSGDEVMQTWLKYIKKIPIRIFTGWDKLAPARDLDDAIRISEVGLEKTIAAIRPDNADSYSAVWRWLLEWISPKLEATKEDDTRARVELIADVVPILANSIERRQFVELISERYKISASLINREATTRNDTPAGFVLRLAAAISEIMSIVATRLEGQGRNLVMFNKNRKTFHQVSIDSERSVIQELSPVTGVLHTFIEEHVGWPPFLERISDADPATYKSVSDTLRAYARDAILHLAKGTVDMNIGRKYRQGYHRITRNDGEVVEVIVCGTDVFHIQRDGGLVEYDLLDGPVYKDLVFDIGFSNSLDTHPWYPGGLDIEQLKAYSNCDLAQLFDDIYKMYATGFLFQEHDVTCQLLAGLVMTFPICDAFFRPPILFVTGDTSSGKTSFNSTISPVGYSGLRLLYCSQGYDNYTPAAVARHMDGDSRLVCLDEFERNDENKGQHVQAISTMIRGLVAGRATRSLSISSGTNTSGVTDQHFRLPVILSGIQGADLVQDLNRLLIIHTQKKLYTMNPLAAIQEVFTDERLDEMRRQLNLGMFAHAAELHRISNEIHKDYFKMCKRLQVQAEERWATGLLPALALMKYIGRDHEAFFKAYVEANKHAIKRVESTTESQATLSAIMHNACIKQVEGPNISLAQLLVIPERRAEINSANKGVYYDAESQSILFLAASVYTLLPIHTRRTLTNAHQVRTVLERHSSAIKPDGIQESGILRRIVRKMGANITLNDVVVLDASSWLQAPRENETVKELSNAQPRLDASSDPATPASATVAAVRGVVRSESSQKKILQETCWGAEEDSE